MMSYEYVEQKTFDEVFETAANFASDYASSGIPNLLTGASTITTIYYLLSARFGNSHIANFDVAKFKLRLFSTIYQYGPTWERMQGIQATLRSMSEADIIAGSKQLNDHAYNPSTVPEGPNVVDGEITTVNEQTKSTWKKSKLEGYGLLTSLLEKDVTEEFLGRFKKLFQYIVEPPITYLHEVEE